MFKQTVFAIFILLAVCAPTRAQSDPGSQSGESMIAKAISVGSLGAPDAPPMSVKAVISVTQSNAAAAKGTYELLWLSSKRWREEVRFGNYFRIRVANAGGYWQSSSTPFRPIFMSELDRMRDVSAMVAAARHESFGKVQEKQVRSDRALCVQAKSADNNPGARYCFDPTTGSLLQINQVTPEFEPPLLVDRVEYEDIRQRGDKFIPFLIETFHQDKVFMTLQISEIGAAPPDVAAAFEIPPNSAFWPWCEATRRIDLQKKIQPQYPREAREKHQSGRVFMYGVIEGDGSVTGVQVLVSAGPSLDAAAMDAVRQWRYKPVTCDGGAVRLETTIEVVFSLRR